MGGVAKRIKGKGLIRWKGELGSDQGQEIIFYITMKPGWSPSYCEVPCNREANQFGYSLTLSKKWYQ